MSATAVQHQLVVEATASPASGAIRQPGVAGLLNHSHVTGV